MELVIFSWFIYFLLIKIFGFSYKNFFLLIIAFLSVLAEFTIGFLKINQFENVFSIVFAFLIFFFINQQVNKKVKVGFLFVFLVLILFQLILNNLNSEFAYIPLVLAFSILLIKKYETKLELFIWSFVVLLNIMLIPFNLKNLGFALFPIYFVYQITILYKKEIAKKNREYRESLERDIDQEIQKHIFQLHDELEITYKKLKEIFKLSNYTLSTEDLNSMANIASQGLINLGYSGVVVFVQDVLVKKAGFFPNLKIFIERIFPNLKEPLIYEDRYILIPFGGKNINGVLAVYKKGEIDTKEVEYLQNYAISIGIYIEKLKYINETSKLRELLNQTLESIEIGIAIVDKEFNLELANSSFKKYLKKNTNRLFADLPMLEIFKEDIGNVIIFKTKFETIFTSKDENSRTFHIKVFPLTASDSGLIKSDDKKIVLIIEDITEKEEIKNQVIQTEKLALIGKLAAGISHDIRNPLAVISQASFNIKREAKKIGSDKILKYTEKIDKNVTRATEIIEKLLNFSKPTYTRLKLLNLREIIDESIELSRLENKNIDIYISNDLDNSVKIYGDKNSLIQVFVNIIINAMEAMDYEGKIEILMKREGNFAVVSIKDTGKGIPETIQKQIFEPFFTTKETGTGLGLAIAYRIIKDHGGLIEFISEENKGTEFIVKLPITEEK